MRGGEHPRETRGGVAVRDEEDTAGGERLVGERGAEHERGARLPVAEALVARGHGHRAAVRAVDGHRHHALHERLVVVHPRVCQPRPLLHAQQSAVRRGVRFRSFPVGVGVVV